MICQICNRDCKSSISLGTHIVQYHKITIQEYYDYYIKTSKDGICKKCGKQTNFIGLTRGYLK